MYRQEIIDDLMRLMASYKEANCNMFYQICKTEYLKLTSF